MKIRFVYGILSALVFYVDKLKNEREGEARGPIVRICHKNKKDRGLLEHELIHVKQFYRIFILHSILYLFCKSYRFKSEVEAYREQLRWCSKKERVQKAKLFAYFIATQYGLDISEEIAFKEINS